MARRAALIVSLAVLAVLVAVQAASAQQPKRGVSLTCAAAEPLTASRERGHAAGDVAHAGGHRGDLR